MGFRFRKSIKILPGLKINLTHKGISSASIGKPGASLNIGKKGYQAEAIDYSAELVEKARELTGIEVRQQSFYELNEVAKYDGIWACASLLHCERDRLTEVLARIFKALKPNGVCYMSFKYGDSDREKEGRSFTDLNEQQAYDLLKQIDQALLLQQWITVDKRPDRTEEWLNILIRKVQA